MKKSFFAVISLACFASALAESKPETNDSTGFVFSDVKVVKTTPVKDQNKSGTCWCFSSMSFFEDELLRKTGKEYDLSEMFVVNHCYSDKADKFVRMDGKINFAQGGSGLDVPYVWERYGVVPESAYQGLNYGEKNHAHYELADVLESYVNAVVRNNKRMTTAWKSGFDAVLTAYLGELPQTFEYEGKTYTPQTFAKSLPIKLDDYIPLTSFTHHPFYKPFALEVADNWVWGQFYNIPMEEMKEVVDNAIDKGYSVVWAADVSEGGFNWKKGYAVLPKAKDEKNMSDTELARWVKMSDADRTKSQFEIDGPVEEETVTQESRQQGFDRHETTDDHGMVIVGKAVDQKGNKYYKVKNSWNTNQIYDGFFYVSEPYFLAKTINIYVNKEAVPEKILNKFNAK